MNGRVRKRRASVTAAAAIGLGLVAVGPAQATVSPSSYSTTLRPGESETLVKTATIDAVPATVDVVLDIDLSGSYWDDLPNLQAQLPDVFDEVSAVADARFALTSFVDYPFPDWGASETDWAYARHLDLTDDRDAFVTTLESLVVRSGGDEPESQYESLYQIATGEGRDVPGTVGDLAPGQDPSWRTGSTRVVVITTDAAFHVTDDSDCAYSAPCPFGYPGPTEAEAIAALQDADIRVIALKAPGAGSEMDALAAATGGSVQTTTDTSSNIAAAILAGLADITTDIRPDIVSECPAEITFDPAVHTGVRSGDPVTFTETISVPDDATPGTYSCAVSFGAAGNQYLTVTVDDGSGGSGSRCAEDGLQILDDVAAGVASGTVHDGVEPLLSDLDVFLSDLTADTGLSESALAGFVHEINCSIVVPVEDLVDELVDNLVAGLAALLG